MSDDNLITCDVLVIGAGVIGLAIAEKLAEKSTCAVVLAEAFPQFGRETSSRNSEVVHSGIYYPLRSNKTAWCIEGRALLYEFCEKNKVPFEKTGKYVVATEAGERDYLEKLAGHCRELGVPHRFADAPEVMKDEPLIKVSTAVFLPETGIVDSHALMQALQNRFEASGGFLAYRHRVTSIQKNAQGWRSVLEGPQGVIEVESGVVVNAAGLGAAELSNQVLASTRYEHRFCRGRYFGLSSRYQHKFKRLVYPVPPKDGLGIHITVDMAGNARLGPDVDWCEVKKYSEVTSTYDCDWDTLRPAFAQAARRYCPEIQESSLSPGLIGVRPKLFLDGKASPDFLIENHEGFIHALGIESPGLTSSLRIAQVVENLT